VQLKRTKILNIVLLTAFICSLFAINYIQTRFGHYHIDEQGNVVYHAHIYNENESDGNDSPFASHKHSKSQFQVLNDLVKNKKLISKIIFQNFNDNFVIFYKFFNNLDIVLKYDIYIQGALRSPPFS
jgi:hypothetical protein